MASSFKMRGRPDKNTIALEKAFDALDEVGEIIRVQVNVLILSYIIFLFLKHSVKSMTTSAILQIK